MVRVCFKMQCGSVKTAQIIFLVYILGIPIVSSHFIVSTEEIPEILALLLLNWPIGVTHGRPAPTDTSCAEVEYDTRYPLTPPEPVSSSFKYRIGVISDLDKTNKNGTSFKSYFKKGYLTFDTHKKVLLEWDTAAPDELWNDFSSDGRGMELSDLVTFNGKLLTIDDKTGFVYEIDEVHTKLYTWTFLADGDGRSSKGFKTEWATVKDKVLYVGSHGRDDRDAEGKVVGHDMQWIKQISVTGEVKHVDWMQNYNRLRREVKAEYPGYVIHESCVWSSFHQRWFFLPRKISKEKFDPTNDARSGSNVILSSDADFSNITVTHVGPVVPTHGFASFQFIPGSDDNAIIAIKSEEVGDETASYVLAFTISGEILYPETKFADKKYEGIEFI